MSTPLATTTERPAALTAGPAWHAEPVALALAAHDVEAARGLATDDATRRRARHGANVLTRRRGPGPATLLLAQFRAPLVLILLGAAALTAWLEAPVDAAVIAGVVVLNALVGFAQEWRARAAIDALAGRLATPATVVRDGRRDRIDAAMLVPGDIVLLEGGDRVPADLRLLESAECAIDESALTGESLPSAKDAAATLDAATPLGDRRTMAYASTHVTRGTARGLVVATGDATEIGRVAELLATAQQLETPLTRRLEHFSRILLALILGFAVVLVLVGTLRGEQPLDMLLAAVALAVAAIPEGLPAALTITLAIGVARMARRRAIIRRLPAVETLGSTTVVCSDKTGTLTENAMTVQQLVIDRAHWHVTGLGYEPVGTIIPTVDAAVESPALRALLTAGVRCNDASLGRDAEGRWTITGDPTEAALLVAAGKGGVDLVAIQAATPRTGALPFASERQWMATRHAEGAGARLVVKGAVERVLARCTTAQDSDGRRIALDAAQVHRDAEALAADGLRVLAIAERIDEQPTAPLDESGIGDLVLLGLVGMLDPPREAAAAAVAACHRAGISVKMITGDHVGTARAIAARIGLRDADGTLHALTGAELARVPTADFADTVARTTVFARVAPEQKLRIVEALQRRGHVVAMTGDGVNDAPALRAADIGVAMGIAGTDVAREASDMVLVDDDFATIAAAVEEGRGVFDNLVKFLAWTLPTNIGEGLVILVAIAAGIALPILPVQILWINMTTAVCLGLTLAVEPREADLMARPPRPTDAPLLSAVIVERMVVVGVLLVIGAFALYASELARGASLAAARTAAVNLFVVGEMAYLFNCRSMLRPSWAPGARFNRWIGVGIVVMLALQLAFTYAPPFQRLFHSAAIDAVTWLRVVLASLALHVVVELEKWWRRHRARPTRGAG